MDVTAPVRHRRVQLAVRAPVGAFRRLPTISLAGALVAALLGAGCRSPRQWRERADSRAEALVAAAQRDANTTVEPIVVETPADTLRRRLMLDQELPAFHPASYGIRDLPTSLYWDGEERLKSPRPHALAELAPGGTNALEIGLADAVRVAAHNSREFQARKDALFSAALALDLEGNEFRSSFRGTIEAAARSAPASGSGDREKSHAESFTPGVSRKFENGAALSGAVAFNLAGMLDGDKSTVWGAVADLSVSIPLLRGAGSLVAREKLTQAERDLVYAVRDFEQYKRSFAVEIENAYLSLVLADRTRRNEDENYRRVMLSTRRTRRMADASRMSTAAYEQSYQSELAARAKWIAAAQSWEAALENFKIKLGLPPDSRIVPRQKDVDELQALAEGFRDSPPVQPESVDEGDAKRRTDAAIELAFERRQDILSVRDRLEDAQRHLAVAEDSLRPELTIGGTARAGEAATAQMAADGRSHAPFRMRDATYGATIKFDPALERTAERNSFRNALLAVERAVRNWQEAEDSLKRDIRQDMRSLALVSEQLRIQLRAVDLAGRRVRNQDLLLQAGRASMTDVLDAQAALVSAQNSLYKAITDRRGRELALQRDLGVLDVAADGVWTETDLARLGLETP